MYVMYINLDYSDRIHTFTPLKSASPEFTWWACFSNIFSISLIEYFRNSFGIVLSAIFIRLIMDS